MKIKKNFLTILCSVSFCLGLALVGCKGGDTPTSGDSQSGGSESRTSTAQDDFIVSFNTKGGTAVANQTIKSGEKVTKPQDPTQEYYTFTGWYWDFDEVTPFDFESVTITSDTTLYAGWSPDHSASGLDNEPSGGGGGGGGSTELQITANAASGQASWAFKDAPVFVWHWIGSAAGSWKKVTFDTAGVSSVNFTLPSGTTNFIMVRCHVDTVTPNWDLDKNSPEQAGKIYNKSNEVSITSSTSYTVTFSDYYKL